MYMTCCIYACDVQWDWWCSSGLVGLDSINSILATCPDVWEGRFPVTDELIATNVQCSVYCMCWKLAGRDTQTERGCIDRSVSIHRGFTQIFIQERYRGWCAWGGSYRCVHLISVCAVKAAAYLLSGWLCTSAKEIFLDIDCARVSTSSHTLFLMQPGFKRKATLTKLTQDYCWGEDAKRQEILTKWSVLIKQMKWQDYGTLYYYLVFVWVPDYIRKWHSKINSHMLGK